MNTNGRVDSRHERDLYIVSISATGCGGPQRKSVKRQLGGIKILKNGRPVGFSDLHTGDKLTATIVTEGPPKVVTEREVQARLSSPPPPSTPRAAEPAVAATPPATAPAAASAPPASAPGSAPSSASPTTSGEQLDSSSWLLLAGLVVIGIAVLVILTTMRRKV
jgi:uncharacterized membrane protein